MADNHIKFPVPENSGQDSGRPKTVEEVFPELHNEALVEAMNEINKEENHETQHRLITEVLKAKFFSPVDVIDDEGNVVNANGRMPMPKNGKFNFKLINNQNGQAFFPVFTDVKEFYKWFEFKKFDEFKKWSVAQGTEPETAAAWKNYASLEKEDRLKFDEFAKENGAEKLNTIVVVFPQIAQLAQRRAEAVNGFVINPMSHNIIFTQDAIANLLESMKKVSEQMQANAPQRPDKVEVQVQLFPPDNIPASVLKALDRKLSKTPEVNAAYFCLMRQEGRDFYLFVIDVDCDGAKAQNIGESLCESAKMFLTKYQIVAAPFKSPFGEAVQKVTKPFYTKK